MLQENVPFLYTSRVRIRNARGARSQEFFNSFFWVLTGVLKVNEKERKKSIICIQCLVCNLFLGHQLKTLFDHLSFFMNKYDFWALSVCVKEAYGTIRDNSKSRHTRHDKFTVDTHCLFIFKADERERETLHQLYQYLSIIRLPCHHVAN